MPTSPAKTPSKKNRKKQTTARTTALVPQPHGGALRNGGTNKGGPGPMPSEVKAASRLAYYERIPVLTGIADNGEAKDNDRIAAVMALGRMGLDDTVSRAEVRKALVQTTDAIREAMPVEQADALLTRIREFWKAL